jgi:hypothetical protein
MTFYTLSGIYFNDTALLGVIKKVTEQVTLHEYSPM